MSAAPKAAPVAGAPRSAISLALRDAFLSALVALGLFGTMIGLKTHATQSALVLVTRPGAVAIAVGLVFIGRLAMLAWRAARPPGRARSAGLARAMATAGTYVTPVVLVLAVSLPFYAGRYWIDLGTLVLTYVMLGWGLNIVVGLAGLLDLGYVAFYAVGAYSFALIAQDFGLGFWTCLPIAGLLAACWGMMLGFPVLRLRGDYLAIVTLAFGEIIRVVINNWVSFTGGPNGLSDIPRPTLFGLVFSGNDPGSFAHFFGVEPSITQRIAYLYYVILGLALLTNWVSLRLRRLPLGRAWEALREDEIACRSLGINVTVTKLTAFAMGAMFAGFAGAFFATREAFISPDSFTFIESAVVLAIVVLGGLGSQLGVALAAVVMIGGGEMMRSFSDYRMLAFGLALVVVMVVRPRGLVSGRTPSVTLGKAVAISGDMVAEGRG
ncbi:MAG: high-affinity branched-chain amino acid ABC transporter permease LivM [Rhodospirillales bacterium]|nr:high-affinity branched-chain amino acid ABC transporter permease LivM [Rhodospirillales bacterium]